MWKISALYSSIYRNNTPNLFILVKQICEITSLLVEQFKNERHHGDGDSERRRSKG